MFITSKNKYLLNDIKIFGTCSIPLTGRPRAMQTVSNNRCAIDQLLSNKANIQLSILQSEIYQVYLLLYTQTDIIVNFSLNLNVKKYS